MINRLKIIAQAVLKYLGDAAHRRFVSVVVALIFTHVLGQALDEHSVAAALELVIAGFGGSWSSRTPALPEVPVEPPEDVS